jgi:hypothetical protein
METASLLHKQTRPLVLRLQAQMERVEVHVNTARLIMPGLTTGKGVGKETDQAKEYQTVRARRDEAVRGDTRRR